MRCRMRARRVAALGLDDAHLAAFEVVDGVLSLEHRLGQHGRVGRGQLGGGFASAAASPAPGTCASDVTPGRKTGGSAAAACARITASAASSAPSSWPSSLGMMPPSSSTILTVASC